MCCRRTIKTLITTHAIGIAGGRNTVARTQAGGGVTVRPSMAMSLAHVTGNLDFLIGIAITVTMIVGIVIDGPIVGVVRAIGLTQGGVDVRRSHVMLLMMLWRSGMWYNLRIKIQIEMGMTGMMMGMMWR